MKKTGIEVFGLDSRCFIGVFRRENKPSVLPREEKRAERQKGRTSLMRAKKLKKEEPLVK